MKTKNRYKRSRVILFIGLLSFHALSSCVNTSGQVGINPKPTQSERGSTEQLLCTRVTEPDTNPSLTIMNLSSYSDPWYKKANIPALVGATTVTVLVGGTISYCLSGSGCIKANPFVENKNNQTADYFENSIKYKSLIHEDNIKRQLNQVQVEKNLNKAQKKFA